MMDLVFEKRPFLPYPILHATEQAALRNAQSNARVSAYMRNLEVSGWMTKPDLSIIEVKKDEKAPAAAAGISRTLPYSFALKVQLANPNAATAEGAVRLRHGNPGMVVARDVEFGEEAWASFEGPLHP